jgi:hypothetical protein
VEPQCSLHSARIAAVKQALATSLPRTWPCPPRQRTAWAERSGLPAPPSRGPGGAARGACVAGRARGPRARWSRTMSWPRSAPRRPRRRWQAQAALHSCHRVPARRGGQGGCPPRGPTAPSALANGPTQAQVPTWPDRACLGEAASRAALTRMCQCRWCRHWPAPGLSIGWELVSKCGVALIGFQTVGRNGTHACNPSCWRQQCHAWHKRSHAPSLHRGPAGCIALTGLCAVGGGGEQGHREAKEPYDTEGHGHQHDEDEWLRGGEQ